MEGYVCFGGAEVRELVYVDVVEDFFFGDVIVVC